MLAQIMYLQRVCWLVFYSFSGCLLTKIVLSFFHWLYFLLFVLVSEAAHRVRIEGVLDALFLHVELLSWTQRHLLQHRLELWYMLLAVC